MSQTLPPRPVLGSGTTPAQAIAQQAAEYLWACATSEDHGVAWCRSPVYQAAEAAFESAAKQAYGLTAAEAQAARDLLSEYGPHDALRDTTGRGVYSYVQAAHRQVAEVHAEQAERATWAEHAPQGSMSDQRDYAALHGQDVAAVVTLADNQVGPFLRKLGRGWSVRSTAWEVTPEPRCQFSHFEVASRETCAAYGCVPCAGELATA